MIIRGAEMFQGSLELDITYLHNPYPQVPKPIQGWRGWRGIETGNGMEADLPGTCIVFKPCSEKIQFMFIRNGLHAHVAVNNFFVFTRGEYEVISVEMPLDGIRQFEVELLFSLENFGTEFRLYFPYANSFTYLGLKTPSDSLEGVSYKRPNEFYLAFGDSITQGYQASHVLKCYASQVSQKLTLPLYSMGFGSRMIIPSDPLCESIPKPAVISVLIGINNVLNGTTLSDFKELVELYYKNLKSRFPEIPIIWLVPFLESSFLGFDPEKKTGSIALELVKSYQDYLFEWFPSQNDPKLKIIDSRIIQRKELLPDCIHPTDEGHEILSKLVVNAIENIFLKDPVSKANS